MIERVFRTMTDSEREEPTLPSALEPPLQLFYRTAVALDSATGLPLLSERLAAATGCSMSGSALVRAELGLLRELAESKSVVSKAPQRALIAAAIKQLHASV